jgi:hypothetical protein
MVRVAISRNEVPICRCKSSNITEKTVGLQNQGKARFINI